ncbi:probable sulfate transporter 4.2 [Malania oleifera]|uniref:probable sulfate transporter 4.2 n=1 Tax=Malania oleifera TaxID=397392 RepID=UPI0025AE5095|nr:probable sulfate transporter 4.2 [Malania oleifera]
MYSPVKEKAANRGTYVCQSPLLLRWFRQMVTASKAKLFLGKNQEVAIVVLKGHACIHILFLSAIVDSSDELYTELAILLALMVGILECIMGLLRLGWLIRFISHSVISRFTTASAIVIALSQEKYFLGYDIVQSSKIVPLIKSIISSLDRFSWPPFVMGSVIHAVLLIMKHLGKSRKHLRFLRSAGPLTAVALGIAFVKIFHPSSISLVGDIPEGLPKFFVPKNFSYAKSLIPTAMLITGVAILESVGIAKALASKNGYELDSNQDVC